jgi:hypothetical protein
MTPIQWYIALSTIAFIFISVVINTYNSSGLLIRAFCIVLAIAGCFILYPVIAPLLFH